MIALYDWQDSLSIIDVISEYVIKLDFVSATRTFCLLESKQLIKFD